MPAPTMPSLATSAKTPAPSVPHIALLPGKDSGVIAENVRSLKNVGRTHAHATFIAMRHANKTSK